MCGRRVLPARSKDGGQGAWAAGRAVPPGTVSFRTGARGSPPAPRGRRRRRLLLLPPLLAPRRPGGPEPAPAGFPQPMAGRAGRAGAGRRRAGGWAERRPAAQSRPRRAAGAAGGEATPLVLSVLLLPAGLRCGRAGGRRAGRGAMPTLR